MILTLMATVLSTPLFASSVAQTDLWVAARVRCENGQVTAVEPQALSLAWGGYMETELDLKKQSLTLEASGTELLLAGPEASKTSLLLGRMEVPGNSCATGVSIFKVELAPDAIFDVRRDRPGCCPYLYWTTSPKLLHWRPHFRLETRLGARGGRSFSFRKVMTIPKGTSQFGSHYNMLEMNRSQCRKFVRDWMDGNAF